MMSEKTLCQSLFFIIFIFNTAMFEYNTNSGHVPQ